MRTLGQKRAEFALNRIIDLPDNLRNEFKPLTAGAPSLILQNGFGHTLAFFKAKCSDKHTHLFRVIREWLVNQGFVVPDQDTDMGFLMKLNAMDQMEYLRAQKEALALLEWIKRFAAAELN